MYEISVQIIIYKGSLKDSSIDCETLPNEAEVTSSNYPSLPLCGQIKYIYIYIYIKASLIFFLVKKKKKKPPIYKPTS
jgi:hypothetical protein